MKGAEACNLGFMKAFFASLLALLAVSACVDAGASVYQIAGVRYSVQQVDDYYWPAPVNVGTPSEIEPFPIATALVVSRPDGPALTQADEAVARAAAEAHCRANALAGPGTDSRYATGTWAFYPCHSPL